jgi:hypothetical protein
MYTEIPSWRQKLLWTNSCVTLCLTESIVSYSAPRGEADSALEDLSYDGILDGNHMRGGLGQLVDGLFGDGHMQDHKPGGLCAVPCDSSLHFCG